MIERCRHVFPIKMMCHLLKVSTSGYYAWCKRPPSRCAQDNARLSRKIAELHHQSDGVFGSPRIRDELVYAGERCSLNRGARLMKCHQLVGIPALKQWRKRKSELRPAHVKNHLERDFSALEPNQKWVTDITYTRTGEGWLYLAVVLDLYSRQVIGWSMSHSMQKELVIQAVLMAVWQKKHKRSVILHSDRGSQFPSHEYQTFLTDHQIVSSMSAVRSC